MVIYYENGNYKEMMKRAHNIKGSSGYIGAGSIHFACYFIQEHFANEKIDLMCKYYPTLVEAAIEFKIHSRKIIADYNKQ